MALEGRPASEWAVRLWPVLSALGLVLAVAPAHRRKVT